MDVTVKYEGTSGENQAGLCYFYLKFVSPKFKKVRVENIIMEPASSRNQAYLSYMHVYDKDTLEYICSSSNATRALVPPDNVPGVWEFEKRLLLENDKTYLYTFTTSSAPSLTNLYATRMKNWPSTTEAGALDVNSKGSGTATYPGTEIAYYPAITFQGEAAPVSGGSVEVGQGYCNVDGTNKIVFSNSVKKDFEDIGGTKGFKNNIVLTLDNSDVSSFILQGVEAGSPTGYKATKALDKAVYLSNNKDMILGEYPIEGLEVSLGDSGINCETIGTPTITEDSIVSSFSSSSYVVLPNVFEPQNSTWEICFKINWNGQTGGGDNENYIFGGPTGGFLRIGLNAGRPTLSLSTTQDSWSICEMTASSSIPQNSWVYIRARFTGSKYILETSLTGSSYSIVGEATSSTPFVPNDTKQIGAGQTSIPYMRWFSGQIDLKESYIKINGTDWWRGVRKTRLSVSEGYAYADENIGYLSADKGSIGITTDVVGSLTITPEFIVSGFSTTDGLKLPQNIPSGTQDVEIFLHAMTGPSLTAGSKVFSMGGNNVGGRIYIETSTSQMFAGYNNGNWQSAVLVPSLSTNTEYWLHVKYSNSTGRLFTEYSTDGSNYTQVANDSYSMGFATNRGLYLGTNLEDSQALNVWAGKIYLQDCKVYLDNKEWWSGVGYIVKWYTLQEIVVHPEDFEGSTTKTGYLSLANPTGTTKVIATGMRNPTKEYTGSVATPADIAKKITLSEDLSEIISVEDI